MDENELRELFRSLDVFAILDEAGALLSEKGIDNQTIAKLFKMYAERINDAK